MKNTDTTFLKYHDNELIELFRKRNSAVDITLYLFDNYKIPITPDSIKAYMKQYHNIEKTIWERGDKYKILNNRKLQIAFRLKCKYLNIPYYKIYVNNSELINNQDLDFILSVEKILRENYKCYFSL